MAKKTQQHKGDEYSDKKKLREASITELKARQLFKKIRQLLPLGPSIQAIQIYENSLFDYVIWAVKGCITTMINVLRYNHICDIYIQAAGESLARITAIEHVINMLIKTLALVELTLNPLLLNSETGKR